MHCEANRKVLLSFFCKLIYYDSAIFEIILWIIGLQFGLSESIVWATSTFYTTNIHHKSRKGRIGGKRVEGDQVKRVGPVLTPLCFILSSTHHFS